jgi:hypothetical protein
VRRGQGASRARLRALADRRNNRPGSHMCHVSGAPFSLWRRTTQTKTTHTAHLSVTVHPTCIRCIDYTDTSKDTPSKSSCVTIYDLAVPFTWLATRLGRSKPVITGTEFALVDYKVCIAITYTEHLQSSSNGSGVRSFGGCVPLTASSSWFSLLSTSLHIH